MATKIKYISYPLIITTIVVITLSGCGKIPDEGNVVLASIGDTTITISDFNERIANLPAKYRDIVKKRKGEYLEELVNDTLLYQEAVRKDIYKDDDVQKVIAEARKKILIARLLQDEVDNAINITEEDIREFYTNNSDKYMSPEIMRVSHILLLSRKKAEKILEEFNNGTSFEDLARAKSVDPTAQRGGDIGYFPKGQLMPEFENACARLNVNEVSGIVKTKLGYHIIKLTDRREPKQKPIEDVASDIKSRLHKIKQRMLFNSLLDRLHKDTEIKLNEEALKK